VQLVVILTIVSYALGTFPSATLIARANGVDISTFGSGNPGASNVTRALGWRKGVWVYVFDALKGAMATGLALGLDGRALAYWCGIVAVIGHMFPAWRKMRGGKGAATGSGLLIVLNPFVVPVCLILWWLTARITGKAVFGTLAAVAVVPVGLLVMDRPLWEFGAVFAISALIMAKHWRNFARLIKREEPTMSQVKAP